MYFVLLYHQPQALASNSVFSRHAHILEGNQVIAMKPVAIVTGGSSGIGLCAARALAARGCAVYTVSRREAALDGCAHLCADVTDEAAVNQVVTEVLRRQGRIDLLVNCAGYGISGAAEFTALEDAKRQLDVNFFGMVSCCKAALPALRASGGRIVNVSSVAAAIPIPFQTFYSVSKAAVTAYTLALANEVRALGVTVCAVEPGDIRTGFTAARQAVPDGDEVYEGRIARSVSRMEHDEQNGMPPERIGNLIAKVALKRRVRPRYTAGLSYHMLLLLAKLLPAAASNRLVGMLYAK